MNKVIIDLDYFASIKEFHLWLKEECHFPEYYGCNLDALYDCLSEQANFEFLIMPSFHDSDYLVRVIQTMIAAKCKVYFFVDL